MCVQERLGVAVAPDWDIDGRYATDVALGGLARRREDGAVSGGKREGLVDGDPGVDRGIRRGVRDGSRDLAFLHREPG